MTVSSPSPFPELPRGWQGRLVLRPLGEFLLVRFLGSPLSSIAVLFCPQSLPFGCGGAVPKLSLFINSTTGLLADFPFV